MAELVDANAKRDEREIKVQKVKEVNDGANAMLASGCILLIIGLLVIFGLPMIIHF